MRLAPTSSANSTASKQAGRCQRGGQQPPGEVGGHAETHHGPRGVPAREAVAMGQQAAQVGVRPQTFVAALERRVEQRIATQRREPGDRQGRFALTPQHVAQRETNTPQAQRVGQMGDEANTGRQPGVEGRTSPCGGDTVGNEHAVSLPGASQKHEHKRSQAGQGQGQRPEHPRRRPPAFVRAQPRPCVRQLPQPQHGESTRHARRCQARPEHAQRPVSVPVAPVPVPVPVPVPKASVRASTTVNFPEAAA
jgi:hypothetical protein